MGRRADLVELLERTLVAPPLCLGERVPVRSHLAGCGIAVLSTTDVAGDLLGKARGIEHSKSRAPRVAEKHDLRLAEPPANRVDELVKIADELLDGHRRTRDAAVEGLAGATLIPVDDGEDPFERRIKETEEARLAPARPAVQEDQRRVGDALSSDENPLVDPAEP
jgi:hypothetical protein